MDLQAADQMVGHIAGCCGGYWPATTREAWAEAMLTTIHDTLLAEEAARVLAARWQGTDRPGFGDYKAVYDGLVRRKLDEGTQRAADERGLPAGRSGVKLLDYLLGLAILAEEGDKSARNEIEVWRKILAPPTKPNPRGLVQGPNPMRSKLVAALPGTDEAGAWFASEPDPLF